MTKPITPRRKRREPGEGGIVQRGENKFLARVFLGRNAKGKRRYQSKLVTGTIEDAEHWIEETKAHLVLGNIPRDPTIETLGQYLDRWLKTVATLTCRPKTIEGYKWQIKTLKAGLGPKELVKIRPDAIQAFYAELSSSTARHCHSVLRAALADAVRKETIRSNPALKVTVPSHTPREIPFLSADQISTLLANSGSYATLFSFMASTGVRPGEAFAVRWSDFNADYSTVTVQRSVSWREGKGGSYQFTPCKTKKSHRTILLPLALAEQLRAHRTESQAFMLKSGIRTDLVFLSEAGTPLNPRNVTIRGLKPALENAKLPSNITLYSLRHSHASILLSLGVHVKVVSERLGHSSAQLTLDTYTKILPGLQEDATVRLNRALFPLSTVRTVNTANTGNAANSVRTLEHCQRNEHANTA